MRGGGHNGICERFHKTILQEFYQVTFRKKIYEDIDQLQNDLDLWIDHYNNERTGGQGLRSRIWIGKESFQTPHSGVFEVCQSSPRGGGGLFNCLF